MQETILIVYLIVSIALVGIILLQQGKGAEMGASFGAGSANTVFGAAGSGNVLTKTTTILAILFFATALSISYFNSEPEVLIDSVLDEAAGSVPQSSKPVSLESELPTLDTGLEAEIAPLEQAPVDASEAVEKTADDVNESPVADSKQEDKKETDNK